MKVTGVGPDDQTKFHRFQVPSKAPMEVIYKFASQRFNFDRQMVTVLASTGEVVLPEILVREIYHRCGVDLKMILLTPITQVKQADEENKEESKEESKEENQGGEEAKDKSTD